MFDFCLIHSLIAAWKVAIPGELLPVLSTFLFVAAWANLSTISLPRMPLCPGRHLNMTQIPGNEGSMYISHVKALCLSRSEVTELSSARMSLMTDWLSRSILTILVSVDASRSARVRPRWRPRYSASIFKNTLQHVQSTWKGSSLFAVLPKVQVTTSSFQKESKVRKKSKETYMMPSKCWITQICFSLLSEYVRETGRFEQLCFYLLSEPSSSS